MSVLSDVSYLLSPDGKGLLDLFKTSIEASPLCLSYAQFSAMSLIRVRWLFFLPLFVLAGFFFWLYPPRPYRQQEEFNLFYSNDDHDLKSNITFPINVTEGSYKGASCDVQLELQSTPEVMEWDSSRVLRGAPTERFRGNVTIFNSDIKRLNRSRQPSQRYTIPYCSCCCWIQYGLFPFSITYSF